MVRGEGEWSQERGEWLQERGEWLHEGGEWLKERKAEWRIERDIRDH